MWYTGEDKNPKLIVKKNGAVEDITGWKFEYALKKSANDSDDDAVVFKTVTSLTDPENGIAHIDLTDELNDITPGVYLETIQLFDAAGALQVIKQKNRSIQKKGIVNNE